MGLILRASGWLDKNDVWIAAVQVIKTIIKRMRITELTVLVFVIFFTS